MRDVFKNYQSKNLDFIIKDWIYQDIKARTDLGISRLSLV